MRCRQQLLRTLVTDIIADVDEEQREVILTIHWKGGQHSQLRIRKPKAGEHGQSTPEAALAIRSEEHTSELPSLMRISYAVFRLNKKTHRRLGTVNNAKT